MTCPQLSNLAASQLGPARTEFSSVDSLFSSLDSFMNRGRHFIEHCAQTLEPSRQSSSWRHRVSCSRFEHCNDLMPSLDAGPQRVNGSENFVELRVQVEQRNIQHQAKESIELPGMRLVVAVSQRAPDAGYDIKPLGKTIEASPKSLHSDVSTISRSLYIAAVGKHDCEHSRKCSGPATKATEPTSRSRPCIPIYLASLVQGRAAINGPRPKRHIAHSIPLLLEAILP